MDTYGIFYLANILSQASLRCLLSKLRKFLFCRTNFYQSLTRFLLISPSSIVDKSDLVVVVLHSIY